jgi:hypothetical protein
MMARQRQQGGGLGELRGTLLVTAITVLIVLVAMILPAN